MTHLVSNSKQGVKSVNVATYLSRKFHYVYICLLQLLQMVLRSVLVGDMYIR